MSPQTRCDSFPLYSFTLQLYLGQDKINKQIIKINLFVLLTQFKTGYVQSLPLFRLYKQEHAKSIHSHANQGVHQRVGATGSANVIAIWIWFRLRHQKRSSQRSADYPGSQRTVRNEILRQRYGHSCVVNYTSSESVTQVLWADNYDFKTGPKINMNIVAVSALDVIGASAKGETFGRTDKQRIVKLRSTRVIS